MAGLVLACGVATGDYPALSERISRDPTTDVRVVPSRPGNTEIDPLLAALGDRRLVVVGTDADLAAVVLRLLRTERLAAVPVGFVPVTGESAAAEVWGLPTGVGAAVDVAFGAEPDRAPLIRDDNGGVLVGVGLSSTDIVLSLSMIIGGIVESLLGVVAGMLMRSQRGLVLAYIVAALMALELTIKIVTFSLVGIAISGVTMVYLVNGVRGLRALRGGLAFDDEQVDVFS